MRAAIKWFVLLLAAVVAGATFAPLIPTNVWWIRGFDFPRLHVFVLGLAALAALAPFARSAVVKVALAVVLASVAIQAYEIAPYTPLWDKEVRDVAPDAQRDGTFDRIRILTSNVLMENRNASGLLEIIEQTDPDLVLLLEPDAWWIEQLASLGETYPHTVERPLDNRYGMALFSRFELSETEVHFLLEEGVPSISTRVTLPSGVPIRLWCVHPKPPSYKGGGRSTENRDAELLLIGDEVEDSPIPVIVTGDLNDVAWSATTKLFKRTSRLLDARVGRGLYNTFSAHSVIVRWPLDHVFISESFSLEELTLLDAYGSDHFPVLVTLRLSEHAPRVNDAPDRLDAEEAQDVEEAIEKGNPREAP